MEGDETKGDANAQSGEYPEGIERVTGEVIGESFELRIPMSGIANAADIRIANYGPDDSDGEPTTWINMYTEQHPGGGLFLARNGDRFSFLDHVFEVDEQTTTDELVINIWTPAELSGEVPYYDDGVTVVPTRPDREPVEVLVPSFEDPEVNYRGPTPGEIRVLTAGDKGGASTFSVAPNGQDSKTIKSRIGDRFEVDGWVFEIIDSVNGESVTFLVWEPEPS